MKERTVMDDLEDYAIIATGFVDRDFTKILQDFVYYVLGMPSNQFPSCLDIMRKAQDEGPHFREANYIMDRLNEIRESCANEMKQMTEM